MITSFSSKPKRILGLGGGGIMVSFPQDSIKHWPVFQGKKSN